MLSIMLCFISSTVIYANDKLPEKYDPRAMYPNIAIKNQKNLNTCWAFATIASLEMNIKKYYKKDITLDENYLLNNHKFDFKLNDGGTIDMALAYISSNGYLGNIFSEYSLEYLKNLSKLDGKNNSKIKKEILLNGSLYANIKWDKEMYDENSYSYINNTDKGFDHALIILGWDDNYPKEKFKGKVQGNGAYICKNSWGKEHGENGYIYISYYDKNIGNNLFCFKLCKKKYDNIYQYDELGKTEEIGYNSNRAWFSNVFKITSQNEHLESIAFYNLSPNTKIELWICRNFKDKNSFSNKKKIYSGKLYEKGYYSIDLDNLLFLKNEKIAIIVNVLESSTKEPIAIESPINGYSSRAISEQGQSYISKDGTEWESLDEYRKNSNVCLKLFTSNK